MQNKMNSINSFSSMYRHKSDMMRKDVLQYIIKTKLHGTNGSIKVNYADMDVDVTACSKNRELWSVKGGLEDGHMGFEVFVRSIKEELFKWGFEAISYLSSIDQLDSREHYVQFFGEWAGPGIQKGTTDAVCKIAERTFFIYAIQVGDVIISDLTWLEKTNFTKETLIKIIPEITRINIPFCNVTDISEVIEEVNSIVNDMEEIDPYIKDMFDVEGTGEGIVGTWNGITSREDYFDYAFKAKTEAHRVRTSSSPMKIEPLPQDIIDLANAYVTPQRLLQCLNELQIDLNMKNTQHVLKWMGGDIKKEAADEIMEMGQEWKAIAKIINTSIVKLWKDKVNEM